MDIFVHIERGRYVDSLETLFATMVLNEQPGIRDGLAGMCNESFTDVARDMGVLSPELASATAADYVIVARAESRERFEAALAAVEEQAFASGAQAQELSCATSTDAARNRPDANLCSIAVPGEYALAEVKRALNAGLHCVVFSNNVPLEDEREMKELAREKGLLCMGPDCGVANINGAALVLASVNKRGPFGICGASGTGIQHVAALLHAAGSGVSQTIGTGGNDLKGPVGGIMMHMGIDALEADPETEYIILISRKPDERVMAGLLERIRGLKKPCVALFMGSERERVEASGAIWARDLDDCAVKALALIGRECGLETDEQLHKLAAAAAEGMAPEQKYVRGAFSGGTYMDEAMQVLEGELGGIWSNAPLRPELKLPDSYVSRGNCCVDYGEEEFTLGRPHPAIDPGVRKPAILREAADPETAVILLDFILTPPGHMDPAGFVLDDIREANRLAAERGGRIAFVASVLGTDADFQDLHEQQRKLRQAGVVVCSTNCAAAKVAAEIIRLREAKRDD